MPLEFSKRLLMTSKYKNLYGDDSKSEKLYLDPRRL